MSVDPVNFLKEVLEIYSPSRMEVELAHLINKRANEIGIKTKIDEVGNVVGEIGEGKPLLLLCSHMDTVAGFLDVRTEDDKIFGRGAVDAKPSLAAMFLAAAGLVKDDLDRKVIVAGVVDEEGGSIGMKNLLKKGLNVDYAIIGEPSRNSHIVVGYRGSATFEIECEAPPVHIAVTPRYVSAIEKSLELWKRVKEGLSTTGKSLFHSVTPCLTMIRGRAGGALLGERWCEMAINVRFPQGMSHESLEDKIGDIIAKFRLDNPKLAIRERLLDYCEPIMSRKSSAVVRSLHRAVRKVTGSLSKITVKTGSSDMNYLAKSDIQAASFGPGDPLLEHTDNEFVDVGEYLQAIEIYKTAIKELIKIETSKSV